MKTTTLRWGIFSVLSFALTSALAQRADDAVEISAPGDPQVIHLDDHTKLTFLGTSYGSHHTAPHFEDLRTANWIYTPANTTVVWIEEEHEPGKWPNYELLVSDWANTGCVNIERRQGSSVSEGVSLQSFVLTAYPRWDKETIIRVKPYTGAASTEQFVLTNPVTGAIVPWTSEPLPVTKSAGDLEVTLTKLVAGVPVPYREGTSRAPTNDPANRCVHLNFDFRQNGQPATNWQAWPVQTTDAAGNWARGLIYSYPTNGITPRYPAGMHAYVPPETDGYFFRPGLWPDQPWKVRLEFIQRFNFSDDEMVTFTNLPVTPGTQQDWDDQWNLRDAGRTNFPFAITPGTVNGMHLKLLSPLLAPDQNSPGRKLLSVIIEADPGFKPLGMNLTVVEATDDQGHHLGQLSGDSWAGHYCLDFPFVREIKSLNLKLALHKSRYVEFTVQPAGP